MNGVHRFLRRERMLQRPERRIKDRTNPLEVLTAQTVKTHFRFWPETIVWMVQYFQFTAPENNRGLPLTPLLSFLSTLYFLSCGSFYRVVGRSVDFQLSKSTVCKSLWRCLEVLNHKMKDFVHITDMQSNKTAFFTKTSMLS